jgi:hypothetical protein
MYPHPAQQLKKKEEIKTTKKEKTKTKKKN